jgi:hypothetical protein
MSNDWKEIIDDCGEKPKDTATPAEIIGVLLRIAIGLSIYAAPVVVIVLLVLLAMGVV